MADLLTFVADAQKQERDQELRQLVARVQSAFDGMLSPAASTSPTATEDAPATAGGRLLDGKRAGFAPPNALQVNETSQSPPPQALR